MIIVTQAVRRAFELRHYTVAEAFSAVWRYRAGSFLHLATRCDDTPTLDRCTYSLYNLFQHDNRTMGALSGADRADIIIKAKAAWKKALEAQQTS